MIPAQRSYFKPPVSGHHWDQKKWPVTRSPLMGSKKCSVSDEAGSMTKCPDTREESAYRRWSLQPCFRNKMVRHMVPIHSLLFQFPFPLDLQLLCALILNMFKLHSSQLHFKLSSLLHGHLSCAHALSKGFSSSVIIGLYCLFWLEEVQKGRG